MWLTAAVGFGLLLVLARGASGPLDEPDPAYQRPGVLDLGALPTPAPRVTGRLGLLRSPSGTRDGEGGPSRG